MTTPQVGVTHDFVIWLNNSTMLGLTTKPFTLKVSRAPTFVASFSVGAPEGTDLSRWKSFKQDRFDGGAGQIYLSSPEANNRYAESNLVDIGTTRTVAKPSLLLPDNRAIVSHENRDDSTGDFQVALRPMSTTAHSPINRDLLSYEFRKPLHVFLMSNAPHAFHGQSAFVYTNLLGANIWDADNINWIVNGLSGEWVVNHTALTPSYRYVSDAVEYSGAVILALGWSGIKTYDGEFGTPAYSTYVGKVEVFDKKLWASHPTRGQISYYDPTQETWAEAADLGRHNNEIRNMRSFSGRLYIGKSDGLWAFESGRMYLVEDFSDEENDTNFSLMVIHRGVLYFNIKNKVYRLSSNNLLELLETPIIWGPIVSGASVGGELFMVTQESTGFSNVYIFNAETGGIRRWFSTKDFAAYRDISSGTNLMNHITAAGGHVWMGPITHTASFSSTGIDCALMGANRLVDADTLNVPIYAENHSYLITSMFDFGLPDVPKEYKSIVVDYALQSGEDKIEVYYLLNAPRTAQLESVLVNATGTDYAPVLQNGDVFQDVVDLTLSPGDKIYFGFNEQVAGLNLVINEDLTEASDDFQWASSAGDDTWALVNNTNPFLRDARGGIITMGWYRAWVKDTVNSINAYWLRVENTAATSVRLVLKEIITFAELPVSDWTLLGEITNASNSRETLELPLDSVSYEIQLMFKLIGTNSSRPRIRRYVIQYLEIGQPYLTMSFTAMALEPIEILDGTLENSASFIRAALFSMAGAGKTYVVSYPYPNPVGTTGRFKVNVGQAGAFVPILAYGHSNINSEIPIRLEEL